MAEQPRVAIVVPALSARGGLASVALFVYRVLRQSGRYEPHLISLATSSTDPNSVRLLAPHTWRRGVRITSERLEEIPYTHVGTAGAELEPLRYRPRPALTSLLSSYDVVQIVAGSPALTHVARRVRRPVALQCATMVAVERKALLRGWGLVTLWRRVMTALVSHMDRSGLRHADVVLVENRWMRDLVASTLGPARVRFHPPGVDTAVFTPPVEDSATDMILAVGRLDDPRKNIPMLLEAFALVRRHRPNAQLVLAGERPPPERVLEIASRLGIAEAVHLRLALSSEDLARLYRSATVLALSSDEEGLGIVILEAMASGVPAVCTRCGGPETSVVDGVTGFLVPIADTTAFANRLVTLLSNRSLRDAMGRASRSHVEQHFSLAATGQAFVDTYDELLHLSSPGREAATGTHGAE